MAAVCTKGDMCAWCCTCETVQCCMCTCDSDKNDETDP